MRFVALLLTNHMIARDDYSCRAAMKQSDETKDRTMTTTTTRTAASIIGFWAGYVAFVTTGLAVIFAIDFVVRLF